MGQKCEKSVRTRQIFNYNHWPNNWLDCAVCIITVVDMARWLA